MTKFLLRIFVQNHSQKEDPDVRTAIGALSGFVGIGCNLLLFACKILIGTLSGSVAITADAMNNLSDASGSIVTLIGFKIAHKPADEHHPYGHARAEYLSGLAVAALILFIGFELGKSSIQKIVNPTPVAFTALTAAVLLLSIGVKLWLYLFNRKLGRHIGSTTLLATAADSRNDCIATTAVLLSGLAERFLSLSIDGWVGLAVAAFILFSGLQLAKETISPLLGESAGPELRQQIVDHIVAQPQVLGYHDLMVHDYGPGRRFATIHVEMDHREDPLFCHELIDAMEQECMRSHSVHLTIHYDPVITDDPELNRLRAEVAALLQHFDQRLTLHDFRMAQGKVHMNLIFDVSLPSDLRGREKAIRQSIEDSLNPQGIRSYHAVITFDTATE